MGYGDFDVSALLHLHLLGRLVLLTTSIGLLLSLARLNGRHLLDLDGALVFLKQKINKRGTWLSVEKFQGKRKRIKRAHRFQRLLGGFDDQRAIVRQGGSKFVQVGRVRKLETARDLAINVMTIVLLLFLMFSIHHHRIVQHFDLDLVRLEVGHSQRDLSRRKNRS